MVGPGMIASRPDAVTIDRITRGNRHLWYTLEVIQQPERARACGAGPKSSADRRPVDPPPVVELRIFEGPSLETAKDITFNYNANFFLFTTLQPARAIAHGRVQSQSAATPPVLTGMPVSGMAYLDRPQEAGYFLFPDLSVRHEGRYRLSFSLYEQTKETADLDIPGTEEMNRPTADMPESFDWRMEVLSNEFVVFSAKKFPGLAESTALSRTVAEQGCRVRIRRDVRMRRREGKAAHAAAAVPAPTPKSEMEDEFARRHRTQTPEVVNRARSLSTESVARTPYVPDAAQRRPSIDHYHTAPSPQPGPSMPPAFNSSAGSPAANSNHLIFGSQHPAYNTHTPSSSVPPSPTYGTPAHSGFAPPQPPQQPPQAPQHAQHHSSSSFSAPSPSPSQSMPPSTHSYYQERPASHATAAPSPISIPTPSPAATVAPSPKRESFSNSDYQRRMSVGYATSQPLVAEPTPERQRETPRQMPSIMSPAENKSMGLPPLSEMIAFDRNQPTSGSISGSSSGSSSANSDRMPSISLLLQQPEGNANTTLPPPTSSNATANKKRSYNQYTNVDAADAYAASIKNHARQPETAPARTREFEELWWKRADGSVWTAHGEVTPYPKA